MSSQPMGNLGYMDVWNRRQQRMMQREQVAYDAGAKFLKYACVMLMLLAILGKPFAYTFLGDVLLIVGVVTLLKSPGRRVLLWQPILAPVYLFILWGVYRTVPFLRTYKLEAVRDAALWGYALWALVFMGLLCASPQVLPWMIRSYDRFMPYFLIAVPPLIGVYKSPLGKYLVVPGAHFSLISVKSGDILSHLGACIAFLIIFNVTTKLWFKIPMILVIILLAGTTTRGGLFGLLAATSIAFACRPGSRIMWTLVISIGFALLLLWATNIQLRLPGSNRPFGINTLVDMFASVLPGAKTDASMEATKQWRLSWWSDIYHYTVKGKYFWTGKGFGVNLADDDGYAVTSGGELRSPHSCHMTVLARMGVPGMVLWIVLQAGWIITMFDGYIRARMANDTRWQAVFAFLVAYWTALLINASFDVFLEGPMGAVWFWSVFGAGLAANWIFLHSPEEMYPDRPRGKPLPG